MRNEQERKRIGLRVAEIRKQKAWTQEELANKCGLGRSHIVRIEQGCYNVQIDTLALIADAFGMTVDFIKKKKDIC